MFADTKPTPRRFTPPKARLVTVPETGSITPTWLTATRPRFEIGEIGHVRDRGGRILPPKRNGASLAADPTLTGVWSLPKQEALRPAFQCRSVPAPKSQAESGLSSPGARAGAGSVGGRCWSRGPARAPDGSETGLSARASNGSTLPVGSAKPRHRAGKSGLYDFAPSRPHRFGIRSVPGRTRHSPRLVPPPRGISPSRRSGSEVPLHSGLAALVSKEPVPRLDVWKMRGPDDSGKRASVHLSTFSRNASGQGWITQRFDARRANYPLSRPESLCARSRRRSALSLMKPAASCWS